MRGQRGATCAARITGMSQRRRLLGSARRTARASYRKPPDPAAVTSCRQRRHASSVHADVQIITHETLAPHTRFTHMCPSHRQARRGRANQHTVAFCASTPPQRPAAASTDGHHTRRRDRPHMSMCTYPVEQHPHCSGSTLAAQLNCLPVSESRCIPRA